MFHNYNSDIYFRLIESKDESRVLEFLRLHFYCDEPLTIGSEPKQQDPEDERFLLSFIAYNTCVMAYKLTADGGSEQIIGVTMAAPKSINEDVRLFEEAKRFGSTKWGKVLHFLACIERDANVYKKYDVTEALHCHVLAVDAEQRVSEVGASLVRESMILARKRGFSVLTADCTSLYSARLCQRFGMECIYVMKYSDYRDADGTQIFSPPLPHTCVRVYAIRL